MANRSKTILFLGVGLSLGGSATAFCSLAQFLENYGSTVKLLLPHADDVERIAVPRRYVVGYAWKKHCRNAFLKSVLNVINEITGYWLYFLFVKRIPHDFFVVFGAHSSAHWSRYTHKPSIGWFHVMPNKTKSKPSVRTRIHEWFELRDFQRFSQLVAVSQEAATAWGDKLGLAVECIQNIINVDHIKAKARSSQEREGHSDRASHAPRMVFVGRIEHEKGLPRLLHALTSLKNEGFDFELWVIGDGSELRDCKEYVTQSGLGDRVVFLGVKSNPFVYVRQCDLLVCPSYSESFGLVLQEALILGIPVLATCCGGSVSALDHGKYGTLCENSTLGLQNGLRTLLTDGIPLPPDVTPAILEANEISKRRILQLFSQYRGESMIPVR